MNYKIGKEQDEQQEEFDSLFRKFADMMLRVAVLGTKSRQEAEDIVQDVFIKLYESTPGKKTSGFFTSEEHLKSWLIRATMNRCNDYHRKRAIRNLFMLGRQTELRREITEQTPEDETIEQVKTLPLKYSQVLYLFYYESYSTDEIASLLKIKNNTVRTRLNRAREMLKRKIENSYGRKGEADGKI